MSRMIGGQGQVGLLGGLVVAGLAFTGWGVASKSEILIALGGAVFGASVSSLLDAVSNRDFGTRMLEVLEHSLTSQVRSDETRVAEFRTVLYLYHPTSVHGELFWRCDKLDFTNDFAIGSLTTVTEVSAKDDPKKLTYFVTAAIRDKRLVLFRQPQNRQESASIGIFPHIGEFHRYDSGLLFKQTWDGDHVVSPCILSFQPLATPEGQGFVAKSDFENLQNLWTQQFPQLNKGCRVSFGWR